MLWSRLTYDDNNMTAMVVNHEGQVEDAAMTTAYPRFANLREVPLMHIARDAGLLALLLVSAPVPPDVARHLVGGALTDGVAYARLRDLTDTIGPRLSGSPGAEAAVQWALSALPQQL